MRAPSGPKCPSGIWVPYRAPISRFHFVIYFFFAGSFGPSNGHPMGTHVGTLWAPTFKIKLNHGNHRSRWIEPQPIKLEFTIYPAELWIYFGGQGHICSQQLAADSHLLHVNFGQNCDSVPSSHPHPCTYFFFLKARRAVMGPAKRGPIWAG